MGLQEQQNVLARLYTDPEFLREFIDLPHRTGVDAGLSSDEASDIAAISRDELSFFSESLYWKRRREVEKLLPLVRRSLSADFDPKFREFAVSFNPTTVKKHLEDALGFCEFLGSALATSDLTRDAAKFERKRLSWLNSVDRWSFCTLNHDFRNALTPASGAGCFDLPRRRSIAVWLRIRGRVYHFVR